ncbi:hypothetical protein P618_201140 [Holospora obtusa F1]|uniref:Uncharacterized protein n=1 Tax=Holospora obtusa F1 TaxID=1399147 RepID=W6TS50_HOLOB|nr:hypothetical protein [Holospora obtusa]ETZ06682.1 hypothetical protein P618_201140 [Holospora obtusa F1]
MLLSTILFCLKDWRHCKKIQKVQNFKSDHIEKVKIFSLNSKHHMYTIFAEKLKAQYGIGPSKITQYNLLKPEASLKIPRHQLKIKSQYGSFFLPNQLNLVKDVILYDTAPELFYKLITQNMSVHLEAQKIFGKTFVSGECGYGVFSGKSFSIDGKKQILKINGPCRIHFFGYNKPIPK